MRVGLWCSSYLKQGGVYRLWLYSHINCFPLDPVHLIDSLIWLSENPLALLANIQAVSSLMHFCRVCQKKKKEPLQGIPSGELSINIKTFALHSCTLRWLTDTSSELVLQLLWGSHSLNKIDGPLKKVYVWFIFDRAQQKACSKIYLLVHRGADWNECGPSYSAAIQLVTCASGLCCIWFPHALWQWQSAVGTCSVHSGDFAQRFWTSFASVTKLSCPNVGFSLSVSTKIWP